MIQGISEAIAASFFMVVALAFGAGFFVGGLIFWALPTAWPSIKAWLHLMTA